MFHEMAKDELLYARVYGRIFRILAVADNAAEANAYMERNPKAALLAEQGPLRLMAHKDDKGENA